MEKTQNQNQKITKKSTQDNTKQQSTITSSKEIQIKSPQSQSTQQQEQEKEQDRLLQAKHTLQSGQKNDKQIDKSEEVKSVAGQEETKQQYSVLSQKAINSMKKEQQQKLMKELDIDKINQFFRYRQSLLLNSLGRKQYYLNWAQKKEEITGKTQQAQESQLKKKSKSLNCEEDEASLSKLLKIVSTKSKYRYRDKIDYQKAVYLKFLNFNFKGPNSKEQAEEYKDLEDDCSEAEKLRLALVKDDNQITNDMVQHWKKVKGYPISTKVFIVVGGYEDLIQELLKFGWKQNEEGASLCFDLKWVTKTKDLDMEHILDYQVINHFKGNGALTSKQGLSKNLKNLIWYNNMNCYEFFPRCYDLNDTSEFEDFIEEFKLCAAESLLKKLILGNQEPKEMLDRLKVKISLAGIVRKCRSIQDKIKYINRDLYPVLTLNEWQIISNQCNDLMKIKDQIEKNLAYDIDMKREDLLVYAQECLKLLEKVDPQYQMSGNNNLWVIKPAGLSRGRGIRTFSNLEQIINYINVKDVDWVGQKYLENIYLINKKKFDIRQWVIITEWKPLTIWMYDENYVRMCIEDLDFNETQNKYGHLTNNSIQKHGDKFEENIDNSMMSQQDFEEYLKKHEDRDAYFESIKPSIVNVIINSMKSVVDIIVARKNSFEMYGYDFMIDNNFKAWLIEVNSSPSMEYSTKVTTTIVKQGLKDLAKLINNYIFTDRKIKKDLDVGKWKLIYKE